MLQLRKKKASPAHLLDRTYQNELRAIGRHCDDAGFRGIGIYEVKSGFVLRGFSDATDAESLQAVEVPNDDIENLIIKNFTAPGRNGVITRSPLCPTGYEDFLRALGYELEANQAKAVAIQELTDRFAVSYLQLQSTAEDYVWVAKSVLLTADDVLELVDEAFRRRGS